MLSIRGYSVGLQLHTWGTRLRLVLVQLGIHFPDKSDTKAISQKLLLTQARILGKRSLMAYRISKETADKIGLKFISNIHADLINRFNGRSIWQDEDAVEYIIKDYIDEQDIYFKKSRISIKTPYEQTPKYFGTLDYKKPMVAVIEIPHFNGNSYHLQRHRGTLKANGFNMAWTFTGHFTSNNFYFNNEYHLVFLFCSGVFIPRLLSTWYILCLLTPYFVPSCFKFLPFCNSSSISSFLYFICTSYTTIIPYLG